MKDIQSQTNENSMIQSETGEERVQKKQGISKLRIENMQRLNNSIKFLQNQISSRNVQKKKKTCDIKRILKIKQNQIKIQHLKNQNVLLQQQIQENKLVLDYQQQIFEELYIVVNQQLGMGFRNQSNIDKQKTEKQQQSEQPALELRNIKIEDNSYEKQIQLLRRSLDKSNNNIKTNTNNNTNKYFDNQKELI